MAMFRLNVVFSGVNFDDDDVFEALSELPEILWRSQGHLSFATAIIDSVSALEAATSIARQVKKLVPSAHPIRLDEDFVAIPDIASRVGVSREAVRNWANGTRHANFPLPRGTVGDGIRIWRWSEVNSWLLSNLGMGDQEVIPNASDIIRVNALFSADPSAHRTPTTRAWNVVRTHHSSSATKVANSSRKPQAWVGAAQGKSQFGVVSNIEHAAA